MKNSRTVETAIKHFASSFVRLTIFLSLHSDLGCVSVVLGVVSQSSKFWRNESGPTGKQKMFEQDFWILLYTPKM